MCFRANLTLKNMPLNIVSWNVNSLRSAIAKGFISWLESEKPDIVCLQEVRATSDKLLPLESLMDGYQAFWNPAVRPGYSGTAILTRYKPLEVRFGLDDGPDDEGRAITADFGEFRVASFYAPNSTPGTPKMPKKLAWLKSLGDFVNKLSDKPFLLAGDFNVAFTKLDSRGISGPSGINGCSVDEREAFGRLLEDCGLYDPAREQAGSVILSTWWSAFQKSRVPEKGIRFDYILLSRQYAKLVEGCRIHSDVFGSDHCPISLQTSLSKEKLTIVDSVPRQVSLV